MAAPICPGAHFAHRRNGGAHCSHHFTAWHNNVPKRQLFS